MKTINTYIKRADIEKNRIIIPKYIIDMFGRYFRMEVYQDGSMKLVPIKGE